MSRRASREFIPDARYDPTPRRMRSHRSTSGDSSSPPFRPSAPSRCGSAYLLPHRSALGCLTSLACPGPTMPSADFCGAVREDSSALSPYQDTPQISRGQPHMAKASFTPVGSLADSRRSQTRGVLLVRPRVLLAGRRRGGSCETRWESPPRARSRPRCTGRDTLPPCAPAPLDRRAY
jgi:hypothetical protein